MAAEAKIDPMHQFVIEPIAGSFQGGNPFTVDHQPALLPQARACDGAAANATA